MRASILLAVVMLIVGGAVGYLLGVARPAPENETPRAAPSTAKAPAPAETPIEEASSPERRAVSRRARGGEDVAVPKTDGPPPQSGDGKITGVVRDLDGARIAGVLVRAAPREENDADAFDAEIARANVAAGVIDESHPKLGAPPRRDVERQIRDYAIRMRRADAACRETTTDASGAYSFEKLGEKTYDVGAWLVGWRIERTGADRWGPVQVGGTCDFTAKRISSATVSVLLPDGTPATQAVISWKATSADDVDSTTWRPGSPEIEISPGTYEISATSNPAARGSSGDVFVVRRGGRSSDSDDSLWKSEPQTVVVDGKTSPALTFQLKSRPGVLVKAIYAGAQHPSSVRIAALRLDGGAAADPSRLLGDARVHARWLTDATEGALALDPGSYLVGATFRGGIVGPTAVASVAGDLAVRELRVERTDLRDWVKVRVLGPDESPVTDVVFEVGCNGDEGSGSGETQASLDADGSYHVEHYEQDGPGFYRSSSWSGGGLGAGKRTYFVRAKSKRFGTTEATYEPGKDAEIVLRMIEPARVRLTISGYAENPDRDRAVVTLEPKTTGELHRRRDDVEGEIDAKGIATFGAVAPGKYDVVLRLAKSESRHDRMNARWAGTEAGRLSVDLRPGAVELSMAIGAFFDLVVTFEGDAPSLARDGSDDGGRRGKIADGGGRETFAGLSPGRYRLASAAGAMTVDVSAATTVAFAPRPLNCFHLQVSERGYLHDLGLKTDDLVVAIDGAELTDPSQMQAALEATKTREKSTFTILRDGRRFDVTADGTKFEEDDGSWYRPWSR